MLEVLDLKNSVKWDEIVSSFRDYDVYYLSGYNKGFMIHGDGEPLLFSYCDDNIRAINVAFKRDISKCDYFKGRIDENSYFDLSSPYGYGGWIIEGEGSLDGLFGEYKSWCADNGIISEVIRFHPVIANQERVREYYDVMDLGNTVCIDISNKDDIWANFSAKNRNVIRKAINNNVTIHHELSKDKMNAFVKVYNATMDRDNADDYYYFKEEFYDSVLSDLKSNTDIYYALYEDKIIASSIILKAGDKLSYHLSGSLKEYGSLAATNLLLYTVACDGCDLGYKTFHLGGGVGSREDSLYKFKKAFYRLDGKQYSIGRMVFDKDKYDYLVKLREGEKGRDNFFPLYRA